MRKTTHSSSPLTAKDIAREVGLSQPTVSRILAGSDGYRVAPETRKRVLDTASRLGYRPNALARSLRQRRTNVVGFYTGNHYLSAHNYFLTALIGGMQRAADAYEMDVLLHRGDNGDSSETVCRNLMDRRIDGLIIHTNASSPLIGLLRNAALPVVAITDAIPDIPSVVCDDARGMQLLIDHLWAKGHRRIAFLRPTTPFYSVEARCAAFLAEMRARGAAPGDFPVLPIEMEAAGPALPALRNMPHPPTAVCCWNDMAAYDLLHACRLAGISVPGDLAIVGFDGFHDPKLMAWPLVTIAASWNAVASHAMHLLARIINDKHNPDTGGETAARRQEVPLLSQMPVTLVPGTTA